MKQDLPCLKGKHKFIIVTHPIISPCLNRFSGGKWPANDSCVFPHFSACLWPVASHVASYLLLLTSLTGSSCLSFYCLHLLIQACTYTRKCYSRFKVTVPLATHQSPSELNNLSWCSPNPSLAMHDHFHSKL
ncbi:hypothetical protein KIL84_017289 [Mauremys mutica]|uniref:Uncharacterized protein n=1 Tax=Mauremys mutica TaxID=74926 RepID=A0A9D3X6J4_9SAUR|nr:hypothetical protein KIL84_017289 [Mauremys mutica]